MAYRETITRPAEIDYTHKKQSGGQGQFARVKLRLEPAPRGAGFSFADACGGLLAPEYVVGLDRGVRAVLGSGVKAGFPVVDVRVAVTDGAFHDADSSALAFEIAGRAAIREGIAKADPILLEPIMRIRVDAPAEFRESVIADLHTRRGEIAAIGDGVEGTVPMQNLFGYVSQLRGMTRGEGRLTLTFERYDPLPLHPEGGDDHPFRPSRRMRA